MTTSISFSFGQNSTQGEAYQRRKHQSRDPQRANQACIRKNSTVTAPIIAAAARLWAKRP
jgi:hypothetical protein